MDPLICIVGPTASGKSDLAQAVAVRLHAEVVSADSMQIYRGMDIGTGKLPESERLVPHHGIDLVDPGTTYSVALFQEYARGVIDGRAAEGVRCILAGGTGFYVRAVVDEMTFPDGEQLDNPVRDRWQAFADEKGAHALWLELSTRDPESAQVVYENDVRRVIRALELNEEGVSYAKQKQRLAQIPDHYPTVMIGLSVDPELLRGRIAARVDSMFEAGLVEEVSGLLGKGLRESLTAPRAIGYKEVVEYLEGRCSLDESRRRIVIATSQYAKRQRTWFRKDKRIRWIDANTPHSSDLVVQTLDILAKINPQSTQGE